jgi:hypothetical protein
MDALEALPAQVANLVTQFSQFREDVAGEFSAVRQELRGELAVQCAGLRAELRAEMAQRGEALRCEIREGDEETRRYMRVLHEDVIERLQRIEEGRPDPGVADVGARPSRGSLLLRRAEA